MPSIYFHQIFSEEVYKKLPTEIQSQADFLPNYYLGAQGGDVLYLYRVISLPKKNIGAFLHDEGVYSSFLAMLHSVKSGENSKLSYVLGYITHYVLDCVFHPFVLSLCQKYKTAKHTMIESDFDSYFIEKVKGEKPEEYIYPLKKENLDLAEIFDVLYDVAIYSYGSALSEKAFLRAVKWFFIYADEIATPNSKHRKVLFNVEGALKLPHTVSGLYKRKSVNPTFLNLNNETWEFEGDSYNSSVDEMYNIALDESVKLIGIFYDCIKNDKKLPLSDFGKNFLSGKIKK